MTDSDYTLDESEVKMIVDARRHDGPVEVVDAEALAAVKDTLAEAAGVAGDPDNMPLEALVATDGGDADVLSQRPETGTGGDDEAVPLDADTDADAALADTLTGAQLRELKQAVKKYKLFDSRDMPNRAQDYADRVEALAGRPPEEIDRADLDAD